MRSTSRYRRHPGAAVMLGAAWVTAMMLAACGPAPQGASDRAFWRSLQIGGDEVEGYATVAAMETAADLVVVGTLSSFGLSRTIQGDAPGDVVAYAAATVAVEEVLSGIPAPDPLIVEFLLPTTTTDTSHATFVRQVAELAAQLPTAKLVLFLRDKGGTHESGLFRLVNSLGLWTDIEGSLSSPLRDGIDGGASPYAGELRDITSVETLAALLRSR